MNRLKCALSRRFNQSALLTVGFSQVPPKQAPEAYPKANKPMEEK
jgi:hypothetical protein